MAHVDEDTGGFSANSLARRIRRDELGMLGFDRLELPLESVVVRVRDLRGILDEILPSVMRNLLAERFGARACALGLRAHRGAFPSDATSPMRLWRRGRRMRNVVPSPTFESTSMRPPWFSTI